MQQGARQAHFAVCRQTADVVQVSSGGLPPPPAARRAPMPLTALACSTGGMGGAYAQLGEPRRSGQLGPATDSCRQAAPVSLPLPLCTGCDGRDGSWAAAARSALRCRRSSPPRSTVREQLPSDWGAVRQAAYLLTALHFSEQLCCRRGGLSGACSSCHWAWRAADCLGQGQGGAAPVALRLLSCLLPCMRLPVTTGLLL